MISFEFSNNILEKVLAELEKADQKIRIAVFQLHRREIFDLLSDKLSEGVSVEIFTLPYDSINEEIREEVTSYFESLIDKGAQLSFCKWNIGDPERTSTAVGRWYSYHGKFIVTDKSAIALSANLTRLDELDAILVYENEFDKIEKYNSKFDKLVELFVEENLEYSGNIRQIISNESSINFTSLFDLPTIIQSDTHINHWITDYPSSICRDSIDIEDDLLIAPFDIKGRNLITEIIKEAQEYIFISTESFTDVDIADLLIRIKIDNLDIRVLTVAKSMDFTDRIQKMFREQLSSGIKIRTIDTPLHAKLIVTDKRVVVSSINLNKMNLGFARSGQLWRENTETISICSDPEIIRTAKTQFNDIFDQSNDIKIKLAEKIEKRVGKVLNTIFGLRTQKEVKTLFARFILNEEIQVNKMIIKIGEYALKLGNHFDRKLVRKNDFLMALILYFLTESKHSLEQIETKVVVLRTDLNLSENLQLLEENNFIEKEEDFYKIKLDLMF